MALAGGLISVKAEVDDHRLGVLIDPCLLAAETSAVVRTIGNYYNIYIYIEMHMFISKYLFLHIYIYTRMCVCIYIYSYIHVYMYIHGVDSTGNHRIILDGNCILHGKSFI